MVSILIVDDEEPIRTLFSEILTELYTCRFAKTVEEAMERLKAESYDVVITDISMPGMSGLELLGHIRQTQPDTPVIVMSGINDEEHAMGLIKMGAFYYLMKPFKISEAEVMVKHAVNYRHELRSRRAEEAQPEVSPAEMESEAELMILERQWTEAYRTRNVAALDGIWADDFVFKSSFSGIQQKDQALSMMMNQVVFEIFISFDVRGSVFGETAATTGRAVVKGEYDGQDISGEYRYTRTYARRLGGWQAISTHLIRVDEV
jgi:CheY-like chemotaxis protein